MFDALNRSVAHDPCREGDRTPLGAVEAGRSVCVRLRMRAEARPLVASVDLLVREHGQEPPEGGGSAWHALPLAWDGEAHAGEIPLRSFPHVAFYVFRLRLENGDVLYYVPRADGRSTAGELVRDGREGKWGEGGWVHEGSRLGTRPMGAFGLAEPLPGFQITVFNPDFRTPAWMNGAIMYQIFPDRFARGKAGVLEEGLAYHEAMGRPVRLHERWDEPVEWKAPSPAPAAGVADAASLAARGGRPAVADGVAGEPADEADAQDALAAQMRAYDPIDFFGGTLAGVREQLPYLASLGVEALYLNPVFEARSNHRYDTADYEHIDPLLGTDDDFRELAEAAAGMGISIVLDAVLSHTGDDSVYFNASGNYSGSGAAQGDGSPYRSWYDFEHPSEGAAYRCWWGYPSLPEVNERDGGWQDYMLADGSGILPRWLQAGARGYRLDVADEIPDDVLERIRSSVKRENPDAAIIGEVWEDATTKSSYGTVRTYALGGALDSVMNYPLRDALVGFALGRLDAFQLAAFLASQQANYPQPLYRSLMNLLSTHDVERVRTVFALGGPVKHLPRNEQLEALAAITPEADARAAALQRLVAGILYALPGMPTIYYGDEKGLQGGGDPFCRATFPWDGPRPEGGTPGAAPARRADCGEDLTPFYRQLGALRKNMPALREGEFACTAFGEDALCIVRVHAPSRTVAVIAANRSSEPRAIAIDTRFASLALSAEARALIGTLHQLDPSPSAHPARCEDGIISFQAPPNSSQYWLSPASLGT